MHRLDEMTVKSGTVLPMPSAIPQLATIAMMLFAVSVALVGGTLATLDRPTVAVIWGAAALTSYCAALLCLVGAIQYDDLGLARWKIGSWALLWSGVAFGIATATWSEAQIGTPGQISISNVLRALWLISVGTGMWALGYLVGPGRLAQRLGSRAMLVLGDRFTGEVRSLAAPWILYAIGNASRLTIAVTSGQFGYVGDAAAAVSTASGYKGILGALSLCAPLAIAAAALQAFREGRRQARLTMAVLFAIEVALGAAAGGKESFIIAVLAVVIPYCAARRRLPKVAVGTSIFIFLIIVIPFNQAYRSVVRQTDVSLTPSQAVAVAPDIFRQVAASDTPGAVPKSVVYLMQRVRQIDSPAIIMQRTPGQVRFLDPALLLETPIIDMVPRSVWTGKPLLTSGYQFSQQYFGLPSNAYTSTADTAIGGFYRYGGWIPVVVGMFIVGCGIRFLDNILDVSANPHAIFLIILLFPSLVEGQEDWQSIVSAIPATAIVWLVAVALIFRSRARA
jgi:hypothetical protein